jgi:hypothetical protein
MGRTLSIAIICALFACGPLRADDSNTGDAGAKAATATATEKTASGTATKAETAKTGAAKTEAAKTDAAKPATDYREEIEELRQLMREQAQQLGEQQKQLELLREQLSATHKSEISVSAPAAEPTAVHVTGTDMAIRPEAKKTEATEQAEAKKAEETGPSTIRYKGVNITPIAWIEAATVSRTHATGADINTPLAGEPYPNSALSRISENAFTARQSRLALLVDTKIGTAKINMYFEGDFLGTGVTSNNRQSNSYVFRQRQLWASLKFDSGLFVSGGQMWSLVTESKKGIENRQEQFPLMIDPQYVVGWAWQRAYGFRVAKNWDKFALGFSIEGPQTTFGGRGSNNNFFFNTPGVGGGLNNFVDTAGYTANKSPDFFVKATFDPGRGHYEIVGILSPFRSRVYPCGGQPLITANLPAACGGSFTSVAGAFNDSTVGGGFGATARLPVANKKIEFMAHFQGGDGIGRYSSAQLADVTARPNGTLAPIRTAAYLAEMELHPNPKFDIYTYYGGEYAARTAYTFPNPAAVGTGNPVPVGYGSQLFNNSGCTTEGFPVNTPGTFPPTATPASPGSSGTCNGDIHHIIEGTVGFWHKIYNGPKGRLQWGATYSYLEKFAWSGNAFNISTGVAGVSQRPKAIDNMVWTSFRYYLP